MLSEELPGQIETCFWASVWEWLVSGFPAKLWGRSQIQTKDNVLFLGPGEASLGVSSFSLFLQISPEFRFIGGTTESCSKSHNEEFVGMMWIPWYAVEVSLWNHSKVCGQNQESARSLGEEDATQKAFRILYCSSALPWSHQRLLWKEHLRDSWSHYLHLTISPALSWTPHASTWICEIKNRLCVYLFIKTYCCTFQVYVHIDHLTIQSCVYFCVCRIFYTCAKRLWRPWRQTLSPRGMRLFYRIPCQLISCSEDFVCSASSMSTILLEVKC